MIWVIDAGEGSHLLQPGLWQWPLSYLWSSHSMTLHFSFLPIFYLPPLLSTSVFSFCLFWMPVLQPSLTSSESPSLVKHSGIPLGSSMCQVLGLLVNIYATSFMFLFSARLQPPWSQNYKISISEAVIRMCRAPTLFSVKASTQLSKLHTQF